MEKRNALASKIYLTRTSGQSVSWQSTEQAGSPSFDDLFEGKAKPYLKYLPRWTTETTEDRQSLDLAEEGHATHIKDLKRQDSIMQQDFYTVLYKSWEGSHTFTEFRFRFGGTLSHKYFSCCRLDDTIFLGIHVLFGVVLLCLGLSSVSTCQANLFFNIYLIIDGILSIFLFPILIMNWKIRVGGCVNEPDKVGNGRFWYTILLCRIILSLVGTSAMIYNESSENTFCLFEQSTTYVVIILEWIYVITTTFLPQLLYGVAYFIAPAYSRHVGIII